MNPFLALILFILSLTSLQAEDDPNPLSIEYGVEPSSTYDNLNLRSRAYTQSFVDLEISGPEPLSFIRYYNHKSYEDLFHFGIGVTLNYAYRCYYYEGSKGYMSRFDIQQPGGSLVSYYGRPNTKCYPEPDLVDHLGGNTPDQNYFQSLKTSYAIFTPAQDGKDKSLTLYLRSGNIRYYDGKGLLQYEIMPSGNKIHYRYTNNGYLAKIFATDATESITLGSITIDWEQNYLKATVTGSNGQKVIYRMGAKRDWLRVCGVKRFEDYEGLYLQSVEELTLNQTRKNFYENHYSYLPTCIDDTLHLVEQKKNSKVFQKINYEYADGYELYLVKEILEPSGIEGKFRAKFSMDRKAYPWIVISDTSQYHRCYRLSPENYIEQIIEAHGSWINTKKWWEKNPGYGCRHRFNWNLNGNKDLPEVYPKTQRGNLQSRLFINGPNNDKVHGILKFEYDSDGFLTKETLCGYLSRHTDALHNTHLMEETFSRYYTYTEGLHKQIATVTEDDGPNVSYQYLGGSDRIAAKLTSVNGQIVHREFYHYNSFYALIEKVMDDGSSSEEEDLADVHERHISRTKYIDASDHSAFGLPYEWADYYLDLSSKTLQLLKRESVTYNQNRQVQEKSFYGQDDQFLYTIYFKYNERDLLISETTPTGLTKRFTYDSDDRCIQEEVIGLPIRTYHSYDGAGRKVKTDVAFDDGEMLTSRYSYDSAGRLFKQEGPYGQVQEFQFYTERKGQKQLFTPTFDEKRELFTPKEELIYNIYNQVGTILSRDGQETKKEYNTRGQLTHIQLPEESTGESFEYYLNGSLKKKTEKNGAYTCYEYNTLKQPISEITYDSSGKKLKELHNRYQGVRLIESIDPMGIRTLYAYDGAGRKIKERVISTEGIERVTEYAWDSFGCLAMTKRWNSEDTWIAAYTKYDLLGREIEVYSENQDHKLLERKLSTYDLMSNKTDEIVYLDDATPAISRTIYNERSEVIKQIDPMGNETTILWDHHYRNSFDQQVLQKTTIDPLGMKRIETFDTRGLLVDVQCFNPFNQPLSHEEKLYDVMGREKKRIYHVYRGEKEERLYTIDWEYDCLGNITKVSEQKAGNSPKEISSTYNELGLLATVTDANGVTLTRTYDALRRLKAIISSDHTIHTEFTYDLKDRLIKIEDIAQGMVTERSYNDFGEIVKEILGNGLEISYGYYQSGHLKRLNLPDQSAVEYECDGLNLLAVQRKDQNDNLLYEHRALSHNWFQRELKSLLPNGDTLERTYDVLGRPLNITSSHFSSKIGDESQAGYDAAGNLLSYEVKDAVGLSHNTFTYDPLYQLQQEKGAFNHSYESDSLYNRRAKDDIEYTVNEFNQVISDGISHYRYDGNGSMIQKKGPQGKMKLAYDALSRLVSMENEEILAIYHYDAFGRRLKRSFYKKEGDSWRLEKEERFLYQGNKEIGLVDAAGNIEQLRILGSGLKGELGAAVAIELEGKAYVPYHDYRGNVTALWSLSEENVVESYRYSAFGEILYFDGQQQPIEYSLLNNPWLFASKRFDRESGLCFFSNRYYDSSLGRFITADPLGFADGGNLYSYVHGNPMIACDPHGLSGITLSLSWVFGSRGLSFSSISASIKGVFICGYGREGKREYIKTPGGILSRKMGRGERYKYKPLDCPAGESHSGRTGGALPNCYRLRVVPGQLNVNADAQYWAEKTSHKYDDMGVDWTCHNTLGKFCDFNLSFQELLNRGLVEEVSGKFYLTNWDDPSIRDPQFWLEKGIRCDMAPICHLACQIFNDYNELAAQSDDFRLFILAHSRGALETYMASQLLPPEVRQTMHIYTIGAAYLIPHEGFGAAVNYGSSADLAFRRADSSRMSAPLGEPLDPRYNVIKTPPELNQWYVLNLGPDHRLDCPAYEWAQDQICVSINKEIRRIN
ncbi:MAG: rhs25 [Chlamydiales bacterium]|jgi:RHS repeat-associated protein|nr:rhs25 [Chlamydiales bacterium]